MRIRILIPLVVISFSTILSQQNWTHYVRTSGHGLNKEEDGVVIANYSLKFKDIEMLLKDLHKTAQFLLDSLEKN